MCAGQERGEVHTLVAKFKGMLQVTDEKSFNAMFLKKKKKRMNADIYDKQKKTGSDTVQDSLRSLPSH